MKKLASQVKTFSLFKILLKFCLRYQKQKKKKKKQQKIIERKIQNLK